MFFNKGVEGSEGNCERAGLAERSINWIPIKLRPPGELPDGWRRRLDRVDKDKAVGGEAKLNLDETSTLFGRKVLLFEHSYESETLERGRKKGQHNATRLVLSSLSYNLMTSCTNTPTPPFLNGMRLQQIQIILKRTTSPFHRGCSLLQLVQEERIESRKASEELSARHPDEETERIMNVWTNKKVGTRHKAAELKMLK